MSIRSTLAIDRPVRIEVRIERNPHINYLIVSIYHADPLGTEEIRAFEMTMWDIENAGLEPLQSLFHSMNAYLWKASEPTP